MPQPIVGVGHSFGATQLTMLSLIHPRIFYSLVLMDPVIQLPNAGVAPAVPSTSRRDLWPSRQEAGSKFRANRFYQAWDPRVLELWIKHGLREVPTALYPSSSSESQREGEEDKRVTLTTSKHQELFTFLRRSYIPRSIAEFTGDKDPLIDLEFPSYKFYRSEPLGVLRRLPEVRPSVLYIFGGKSDLSSPELRAQKLELTGSGVGGSGGVKKGKVKEFVLPETGHLVAMEKVGECAGAISGWLGGEMKRWREERKDFERMWVKGKDEKEKSTIDEGWAGEVRPKKKGRRVVKL